jgi:antirestriction protein ArdC
MNAQVLSETRFDVHQSVTQSIIAAIEAGAGAFIMPWHGSGAAIAKPQNAHTKMEYHGVNILALWAEAYNRGYQSGYWASYRQWQEAGAQVRKGERGSIIVFVKRVEKEDEEGQTHDRLIARATRVFNADQVTDWQPPIAYVPAQPFDVLEAVETFVVATKAIIEHGRTRACYQIDGDYIEMPERGRFIGKTASEAGEAYSATLLHELVHWSGANHRLDRDLTVGMNTITRAAEELVAEIGAAFLCADLGVSNTPRPDHAAYVASWLQALKDDGRAIFRASHLANMATTYLHELVAANEW